MTEKHNNLQGEVWTDDDDIKLAEIVLRKVREGNSVIDACKEFEEDTNGKRTAQASKFRWHTRLKDQYAGAYEIAKKEGKKAREYRKRRVNQGERYEDLVTNVLDKNDDREITIDDILVLVKRYKNKEDERIDRYEEYEKEINKLKRENSNKDKEIKNLKGELENTKDALLDVNNRYKQLLDALKVLKNAGIQINMPEQDDLKYVVNKDGTVEKI